MKRIFVTAGTVYGPLDDNKLVGNRTRGIWAAKFATWLSQKVRTGEVGQVTVLVPDIQKEPLEALAKGPGVDIRTHKGFWDYQKICEEAAPQFDVAVMAAAVVNWIPKEPYKGKMPTDGFNPGDEINIPFVLAPRVIDSMRRLNPKLTLIGCKMTSGATQTALETAAYKTLIGSRANVVIANDLSKLDIKRLIYKDRSSQVYDIKDGKGETFYRALWEIITDAHFESRPSADIGDVQIWDEGKLKHLVTDAEAYFEKVVDKHRARFVKRYPGAAHVFGALAVPLHGTNCHPKQRQHMLISGREKNTDFTAHDAVITTKVDYVNRLVYVENLDLHGQKASLNAPLLMRHFEKFPWAHGVIHLHEQLRDVPTEPYAPPGTRRDNMRRIPGPAYNIEGHGFVACLDEHGEIVTRKP
jgi:hypothetical protein